MGLAGMGWLLDLWAPLADEVSRIVQPLGFLAEVLLMVWLLAKGVNEERWRMLASHRTVHSRRLLLDIEYRFMNSKRQ